MIMTITKREDMIEMTRVVYDGGETGEEAHRKRGGKADERGRN